MCGAILPLLHYASMEWCSVRAQGQLYLYLYKLNCELEQVMMAYLEGGGSGDDHVNRTEGIKHPKQLLDYRPIERRRRSV
jgi:hypothetical protein